MVTPNAKICPRCSKVVPIQFGVCDHCARLFRTPIDGVMPENRTMMFHHLPLMTPPQKAAPVPVRRRIAAPQRLRLRPRLGISPERLFKYCQAWLTTRGRFFGWTLSFSKKSD